MDSSHNIARLSGPLMCAIGVGMLANGHTYQAMAGQFVDTYALIYFSGILALVAGLAILNMHNTWTADWRSLITLLGWVLLGVGTFRVIGPQYTSFVAGAIITHSGFIPGAGIVLLALGGFITFKGYSA